MRLKMLSKSRVFGQPKSIQEAEQLVFQPELNTIIKWLCKIEGLHRSGNPMKGFFFIPIDMNLFSHVDFLERNGCTINKVTFRPITLRDLI